MYDAWQENRRAFGGYNVDISGNTIAAELGIVLIAQDDLAVPLIASLYYSPRDPYAVRMAFHVGTDEPIEWVFARDLLSEGLATCAGAGDVKIWPSAGEADDSLLNLQLSSPMGLARFQAPADEIAQFLRRTCELVQFGAEASEIDLDGELAALLGGA